MGDLTVISSIFCMGLASIGGIAAFHPKATLRADITPVNKKEAETFLSEAEEETDVLDEIGCCPWACRFQPVGN